MVAWTMMIGSALGKRCRNMMRGELAPTDRAAVMYSCSLSVMNCPRTRRAVPGQDASPITMMVVRSPGVKSDAAVISNRISGNRQQDVGEAHQRLIDETAEKSRQRPEHHTDGHDDDHRSKSGGHRDAPAPDEPRIDIAAVAVGAEPVGRRRAADRARRNGARRRDSASAQARRSR